MEEERSNVTEQVAQEPAEEVAGEVSGEPAGEPVAETETETAEVSAAESEETEAEAGSEEWYRRDREAFVAAHPDVSLDELIRDEHFQGYCDGKVGRCSIEEMWQGYCALVASIEERVGARAAQSVANRAASPGTLSHAGVAESDYFSAAEVRRMSPQQVSENYDKIRRSMARW